MKYILNALLKYYRNSPAVLLKTIIFVLLCTLMLSYQITNIVYLSNNVNNKRAEIYGEYESIALSTEHLQNLSETAGETCVYTFAQSSVSGENFLLGTSDNLAITQNHIHTVTGRLPVSEGEIAIEETSIINCFPGAETGDELTVIINSPDSEETHEIQLTLCGIISDYSYYQWDANENNCALPNALILQDTAEWLFPEGASYFYYTFIDSDEIPVNSVEKLDVQENHSRNSSLSDYENINYLIYNIFAIAISILISILIQNLLFVTQKNIIDKRIGLLKLCGFSCADLKKYLVANYIFVSMLPTVVGIVCGYYVFAGFDSGEKSLQIKSCLISFIFCFPITVFYQYIKPSGFIGSTVCNNLNNFSTDSSKLREFNKKIKNPVIIYAVRKFISGGDVAVSSAVMIFASFAGILISVFISDALSYKTATDIPADYTVMAYDGQYDESGYIPSDPFFGLSQTDLKIIESNRNVSKTIAIKRMPVMISGLYDDIELTSEEKIDIGFDGDEKLYSTNLTAFDDDFIEYILTCPYIGRTDISELNSGRYVIAVNYEEEIFSVGDQFEIKQCCNRGDGPEIIDIPVTVSAVINIDAFDINSTEGCSIYGSGLIWGNHSFDVHGLPVNCQKVNIRISNSELAESTKLFLSKIINKYSASGKSVFLNDYIGEKVTMHYIADNVKNSARKTGIILFVITFSEILINLNLSIIQQRKTIGALRAAGLTEDKYAKTLILQLLIQIGYPLIIGGVISVLSIMVLNNNIFGVPVTVFPFRELIFCIIIFAMSSVVIAIISAHRFFKISVSECMK